MSLGPEKILVILVVALLVFGPERLPEIGRQVGAAVRALRRMQDTVRGELDMVMHPEHGTSVADAPPYDPSADVWDVEPASADTTPDAPHVRDTTADAAAATDAAAVEPGIHTTLPPEAAPPGARAGEQPDRDPGFSGPDTFN